MTEKELDARRKYHRIYRKNQTESQKELKRVANRKRYVRMAKARTAEAETVAKSKRKKFAGWMDYRCGIMAAER